MKSRNFIFNQKEMLFAWRYFKAKKSTNIINFISWTCVSAILVGTCSLIVVLSVFNGLEDLVKSLYSSFYTDIRISPSQGKNIFLSPQQIDEIKNNKSIKTFSLVVEEKALLQNGGNQTIIKLKGVDENFVFVSDVEKHLYRGKFSLGNTDSPEIVIGAGVEDALGLAGEFSIYPLMVYLPRNSSIDVSDPFSSFSSDTISQSGSFVIQQDFDNHYGITNIAFVKKMLRYADNQFSEIEIALQNSSEQNKVKDELKKMFPPTYFKVETKFEQNKTLFQIMENERWFIFIILSLVLAVAAFTMIGAITMLVLEKQKDIEILHTLGANNHFIQKIFLFEGLLLAIVGLLIGMLLAVLFTYLQTKFKLIQLGGTSFLIDYFPMQLRLKDFLQVGIIVFVITLIASLLPALKASRQKISLRSE